MATSDTPTLAFLADGGETGALIRSSDWSQSPLGPPAAWPQSLLSVVGLLLNSKFPMFVAWGDELGFLYNDAYAEILGAKHPAALGRRFHEIWAEIWDDILPIIEQAMQGNATYYENLPLKVSRKGYDEDAWFTFSYSPVRDESGKVAGMFCAVTETTDQVLAERHRDAEYERLRQLFQQAPGVIAVLRGPEHTFEIANDAYLQLVGHRQILGRTVREALPEVAAQGFFELLDRVYASGKPYVGHEISIRLRRRPEETLEERFVNFVYQPTVDHRGDVSGIFVEGSDVTEAVRAHRALLESEQRLRQLANTIPQLAWMADPEGTIHWYNDRYYEYTGLDFQQLKDTGWQNVVDPAAVADVARVWKETLAAGKAMQMTFPLRGADGKYRHFFTSVAPLRDADGNIVRWFGTNTDVTPLESAQNELKADNRRKDEFLAMLAHELRNPLAPIATAAELLKLTVLNEDRVRSTSDVIARQVQHMTELVDDLLDVSRVTRGLVTLQEEALDVRALLADAVEQVNALMESKRHHFTVQVPDEQVFVRGDRTRLVQVFSNILNNAAKYTPPNGHVTLRVAGGAAHVEVAVEDDGIGIAPALQPFIFDLFTQAERSPDRSQGGLGLGLALVKSLLGLQGGEVSVHSEGIGKGSRFTVRLPRVADEQSRAEAWGAKGDMPRAAGKARVLVVDDNRDAAQMLSLLLETAGHEVAVTYNAQAALALAQQVAPAVLFVDIGLPDMDGYELARRLRASPGTARALLVAVTGYGQPEVHHRALEAGFDHHLVKPVKVGDILGLMTDTQQ